MVDINRMEELIKIIEEHNRNYYELDNPTISDPEYDALYDELVNLEKKTGIILDNSPTKKVGGAIRLEFIKTEHKTRLFSLDKCKSKEGLLEWYNKIVKVLGYNPQCSVEYKYDGLTLKLTYSDVNLIKAANRGNGIVVELVTEQVKTINYLPLKLEHKGEFETQGEGIMRLSVLKALNENSDAGEQLKNARNAAAGGIRNLDTNITKKRNLDLILYNIGYNDSLNINSQELMHNFLSEQGFNVGDYFKMCSSVAEIYEQIDYIESIKESLDYLIDGAVIKVNCLKERELIGYTEKFPKWAIAYKFKSQEVTTKLIDVIFQVSRTGKLNPLAILEPVDIGGVTVKRATLSNIGEIKRKDIKINSIVNLRRSNDVIPEILGVAEHTEQSVDIKIPDKCPMCDSEVVIKGAFLYCANNGECANQVISRLTHFTSKGAMNIEGLNEKTIEAIYNNLDVRNYEDIYTLKYEDLIKLAGFTVKKKDNIGKRASNLINNIEKSKTTTLTSFIYALGIPNIGLKSARQLKDKYNTLENIMNATIEDLNSIYDFGEIMSRDVVDFFVDENNRKTVEKLINLGITFKDKAIDNVLNGKRFVVTGSLEKFKRAEIEELIALKGGEVSSAVSKNTDYLICGSDAGSKLNKANELGVSVISEEDFIKMLKD